MQGSPALYTDANKKRFSSARGSVRGSIVFRSSLVFADPFEKQRKSELFLSAKDMFSWESFKKNPRASFFEDPKCMEIITKEQLLEVYQI